MKKVELLEERNLAEAQSFLARFEDSAQFLIGNIKQYGYVLTDHHNSGNFKLVRVDGDVAGVFCLTRRGNLLAQCEGDFTEEILESCSKEPMTLKGFVGDWESLEPIVQKYRAMNPSYKPFYESKEILYRRPLPKDDLVLVRDPRVRLLEPGDFDQWLSHSIGYMTELNLPDNLTDDQRRVEFETKVALKLWWGLFIDGEMVSRTALNSTGDGVGQVGGVYTPPEHRKKGYSKATMLHMLRDCMDLHGHAKSILFTGATDIPAQMLYESIGYQRVGHFALILS